MSKLPRTPAAAPIYLSLRLPHDVADLLHRLAYETGRSKLDLTCAALRETYADDQNDDQS